MRIPNLKPHRMISISMIYAFKLLGCFSQQLTCENFTGCIAVMCCQSGTNNQLQLLISAFHGQLAE